MFYTLFNPIENIAVPVSIDPKSRQLGMMFRKDLSNCISYYRDRTQFLENSHILVKLINLLHKYDEETIEECYSRVSKAYRSVCSPLGITTYATIGKMHPGEFYQNTQEYIFANDKYFAVSTVRSQWQDMVPVKALCHEVKNLNFILPGPLCHCDSAGYSVVEINPVMLACMYKAFTLDTIAKNKYGYSVNPKEFITHFVLPNMLPSHMSLVLANRAADLAGNRVLQAALNLQSKRLKQPFYIYSKAQQIDSSLLYQIKNLQGKTTMAKQALSGIGLYTKKNLFQLFQYQSAHRSVQLDWIYALVFLKYFDVLKSISFNDSLIKRSKGHLYQMSKELIRNGSSIMGIKMAYKNKEAIYKEVYKQRLIDFTALSGSTALQSVLKVNKLV